MRSLEQRLARIREGAVERIPAETLAQMHAATRTLVDSNAHEAAHGEGDQAPDFDLPDSSGNPVSLSGLLSRGPAVVAFFRGNW